MRKKTVAAPIRRFLNQQLKTPKPFKLNQFAMK